MSSPYWFGSGVNNDAKTLVRKGHPSIEIVNHCSNHLVIGWRQSQSCGLKNLASYHRLFDGTPSLSLDNIHVGSKRKKPKSRDHPMGGILGKASKIVILCYYVSIFYLNNYCKIIQNI